MIQFTPKSEQELAAEGLWPKCEVDFEVTDAEEKTYTSGPGFKLSITCFNADGNERRVTENLVLSPKAMFKVSQFCKCVGLYDAYKAGALSKDQIIGRGGKAILDIEAERDGYAARNRISRFVVPKAEAAPVSPPPSMKVTPQPGTAGAIDASEDSPF